MVWLRLNARDSKTSLVLSVLMQGVKSSRFLSMGHAMLPLGSLTPVSALHTERVGGGSRKYMPASVVCCCPPARVHATRVSASCGLGSPPPPPYLPTYLPTCTLVALVEVTFVGEGFTRKAPKYERFIRPSGLRFKKAHVTHPELKATFHLDILGVKKNPSSPLYTQVRDGCPHMSPSDTDQSDVCFDLDASLASASLS